MLRYHQLKGVIKSAPLLQNWWKYFQNQRHWFKNRIVNMSLLSYQSWGTAWIRLQQQPRRKHSRWVVHTLILLEKQCSWLSALWGVCNSIRTGESEQALTPFGHGCCWPRSQDCQIIWKLWTKYAPLFMKRSTSCFCSWKKGSRQQGKVRKERCQNLAFENIRKADSETWIWCFRSLNLPFLSSYLFLDLFFFLSSNTKQLSGSFLLQDHVASSSNQCTALIHKLERYFI